MLVQAAGWRRVRRIALVGIAAVAAVAASVSTTGVASAAQSHAKLVLARASQSGGPDLGPNVIIFRPSMSTAEIQATVDAIATQQIPNQFGTQRYALLFAPGSYGSAADPLTFQVGYYTEVAGLGKSPTDVTINGAVDVANQCTTTTTPTGPTTSCDALDNFWRSMSNLTINVTGQTGCQTGTEFWAVSQAAPLRRVNVTGGNLSLQDFCTAGPQFASGGFIADSAFSGGTIINGSQQQFIVRNSSIDGWTNGVWNQVFAGDVGAPAQSFPSPPYTTLATTPASREEPYLYLDAKGRFNVFVPTAQRHSSGTTWQNGQTPGHSLPISDFFIATPSDSVRSINAALDRGKSLIVTPGVYDVNQTIRIRRADTIVLGMGMATLTPQHGVVPMSVDDVRGVDISGLMFDAGAVNSPVLLQVGSDNRGRRGDHSGGSGDRRDPTTIQDVFFRIGGPHVGKATVSLKVNSDNTILDDIWAWRADHGSGVGWTVNTARNGVVVNGNRVTATGLFVEHYQKYDVVWKGERGTTVFFQNEMPYDPPSQAAWEHHGVLGFAAYKVANDVRHHRGWGLGSYIFTNVVPTLHASHAFEVPVGPGIQLHDLLTVSLNKAGTIDHVVNDTGGPVTPTDAGPSNVVSFP
jgi:Pectate lyase superfamily protein